MKLWVIQLHTELKTTKKLNKSALEFVFWIKVIYDSFLSIGDYIYGKDHIDAILDGLPEEYNPFMLKSCSMFRKLKLIIFANNYLSPMSM